MDDNLMLIKQFQMQGGSKGADAAFAEEYRNYQQIQNVYMGAIREIRARLETLDTEFQYRHKHNPIHHIQSRVKTLPSIMKKLSDMGQPMTITSAKKHLHDIAGVRVVCCYVDDIYRIAELLLSQDDISLIFEKDYIKQPKPNGYRSYHMILSLSLRFLGRQLSSTIWLEVQLRTIAMDCWACMEHQLKYKRSIPSQKLIVQELKRCADEITSTDLSLQAIRELIESPEEEVE